MKSRLTSLDSQRGATLIIVLMVLLIITIVGVISVRQSVTDLRIATSSQISKLLFQNSDSVLEKIEREDRSTGNSTNVNTLVGFTLQSGVEKQGREVVTCLRPRSKKLLDLTKLTERSQDGTGYVNGLSNGFCNPGNKEDFISKREATMTQVTLVKADRSKTGEAFSDEFDRSSISSRKIAGKEDPDKPESLCGYATSVLPAFAKDKNKVYACMQKLATGTNSISECLKDENVPFDTHIQEYESKPRGLDRIAQTGMVERCGI